MSHMLKYGIRQSSRRELDRQRRFALASNCVCVLSTLFTIVGALLTIWLYDYRWIMTGATIGTCGLIVGVALGSTGRSRL